MKNKIILLLILAFSLLSISLISSASVTYNFSSTYQGINSFAYHCNLGTLPINSSASIDCDDVFETFTNQTSSSTLDLLDNIRLNSTPISSIAEHYMHFVFVLHGINSSDVTNLTINYEGYYDAIGNFSPFMWNYTKNSWYALGNYSAEDIDVNKNFSIDSKPSDFIDNSNSVYFHLWHRSNTTGGSNIRTDYASLTIDYTPTVISTIDSPNNDTNSTLQSIYFVGNSSVSSDTLANSTLYIWHNNGTLLLTSTETISGTANSSNISKTLADGKYIWNYLIFSNLGISDWDSNRTITIDSIPPQIQITYPTNGTNSSNNTLNINYTTMDSTIGLNMCWYSKNGGSTNTTITCNANITSETWSQGYNTVKIWSNDSLNNLNSSSVNFFVDSIAPGVNIITPVDYQAYTYGTNIQFNVTEIESGIGLSMCWYSNNSGATNHTFTCGNNFSISEAGSGTYNTTVWENDSLGNLGRDDVFYVVSLTYPAVTINHPTNNLYSNTDDNINFNVTATDSNGISNCSLWTNTTGTWHLNQTNTSAITSGVRYMFLRNISDGYYKFNFQCFDNTFLASFGGANFTFTVDTIYPILDIFNLTTTSGSQTITFNTSINDTNLNATKYSIYNSSGMIDGLNNNISINANTLISATATAFGTFTLRVYHVDKAGNENYTEENFTTSNPPVIIEVGGGGTPGITDIIQKSEISKNVTIQTINQQKRLDISLAKDSVRPRKGSFTLINKGVTTVNVIVICSIENATDSEYTGNYLNWTLTNKTICSYVKLNQSSFTLTPNENQINLGEFEITVPENASVGDIYYFNLFVVYTDGGIQYYDKLSISARVTFWAYLSKWVYVPKFLQKEGAEPKSFQLWYIALVIGVFAWLLMFLILSKVNREMWGFFLGLILFLIISYFILVMWGST